MITLENLSSANQENINVDHFIQLTTSEEGAIRFPGNVIQTIFKFIRIDDYAYTGAGYNAYWAHLEEFRTKIVTKADNSAIQVTYGLNGEPNTTHDWGLTPVRSFNNTQMTPEEWDFIFGNMLGTDDDYHMSGSYQMRNRTVYTNPGNYPESDRDSTPIQTCIMEIIDVPNKPAGTPIWYSCALNSTANNYWRLNACVNLSVTSAYERGVSFIKIEEIAGPYEIEEISEGVTEYRFG